MKKLFLSRKLIGVAALFISAFPGANAAEPTSVLIGKDGWLFTPYEFAAVSDAADTQASIQLFEKINKLF